jgi:hypothetical protein
LFGVCFAGCGFCTCFGDGGVESIRFKTSSHFRSVDLSIMTTHLVLTIDDAHYRAVGRVMVHWSYVEMAVDRLIEHLSKVPPKMALTITVGQNMSFRLDVLASLSERIKPRQMQGTFAGLIARSRALMADLNFVAHAVWLAGGPHGFGYLLKKNTAGVRSEKWEPSRVDALADEILTLAGNYTMVLASLPLTRKERQRLLQSHLRPPPEGESARTPHLPRSSRA